MKKIISESINYTLLVMMFLLLVGISCSQKHDDESTTNFSSSFELAQNGLDTINVTVNGLKQGKWVVKKNDAKETVYYKNDTIIE